MATAGLKAVFSSFLQVDDFDAMRRAVMDELYFAVDEAAPVADALEFDWCW